MAKLAKTSSGASAPETDKVSVSAKAERLCITVKIRSLRPQVSALNDQFALYLYDMLLLELLRPFSKIETEQILQDLVACDVATET